MAGPNGNPGPIRVRTGRASHAAMQTSPAVWREIWFRRKMFRDLLPLSRVYGPGQRLVKLLTESIVRAGYGLDYSVAGAGGLDRRLQPHSLVAKLLWVDERSSAG